MTDKTHGGGDQTMRSDARRNRRKLLNAATELILSIGGEPSRDAVARAAGVGIGTLYRHFPDQQHLLRAVALDVLDRTIAAGKAALNEADVGAALRRYLHAAIDIGLGAVNIIHPLLDDTDWPEQRTAAQDVLDRMVDAAHREGVLPTTTTATDIALSTIRFCRPLAIGLDAADERDIAHLQLDSYLDGLMTNSELLRMDNVGIVVESLDAVIPFFSKLGMKLEGRTIVQGEWAGRVTGLGDQEVEIATMVTPDGHSRLELSRFLTPSVVSDHRNAPVNSLGYLRAMFTVSDIDETLKRLRGAGATLVGDVVQYEDIYRLCYIRGPEGVLIGIAEQLSTAT